MLTCLEFQNFRTFQKLKLDGFQRVNLIIGKNNSGKTSLLEGLITLLDFGSLGQQVRRLRRIEQPEVMNGDAGSIHSWFIKDSRSDLKTSLMGLWESLSRDGVRHIEVAITSNGSDSARCNVSAVMPDPKNLERNQPVNLGEKRSVFKTSTVSAQAGSHAELVRAFGKAILVKGGEEAIESVLNAIDPRIQKIRIGANDHGQQVAVDLGQPRLTPLSQMGQSIYRVVEILSEIIGSGAKVCFIDEIEVGVHHSTLLNLWKGIASVAKQFDVQIFATTQSVECVQAAHLAFAEQSRMKEDSIPYDLAVIQLSGDSGRVLGRSQIAAGLVGETDLRG